MEDKNELRTIPKVEIDRVGNISQKELALSISGVTRRRVYEEIGGMLRAMKKVDRMKGGVIVEEEEPDMVMRARGVELALKAFGDLKEFDKAGSVTNNFTFATMVQIAHKADREVIGVDKNDRHG